MPFNDTGTKAALPNADAVVTPRDHLAVEPEPASQNFVSHFLAGALSGIISRCIGAPIERVKLIMQTQRINSDLLLHHRQYKNPIECVIRIYQEEGLLSFWRGNLANVYRYATNQALSLSLKDRIRAILLEKIGGGPVRLVETPSSSSSAGAGDSKLTNKTCGSNQNLSRAGSRGMNKNSFSVVAVSLLSGGLSGAIVLTLTYPLELARTVLAVGVPVPISKPAPLPVPLPVPAKPGIDTRGDVGKASSTNRSSNCRNSNDNINNNNNNNNNSQQRSKPHYKFAGTVECLTRTYHAEGIKGVYAGFPVSLLGVIVFRSLYLGGYDIIKDRFDLHESPVWKRLCAAQALTTTVGTMCFPIDTVKRRMMVQGADYVSNTSTSAGCSTGTGSSIHRGTFTCSSGVKKSTSRINTTNTTTQPGHSGNLRLRYRSSWHCVKCILREEGIRGFFSGLSVNLVRGVTGSILLVTYDEIKRILQF